MAKLDDSALESVANSNYKTIAEAGAFYQAQAMGNHVASQKRLDMIAESAVGSILRNMNELDPAQALSLVKANTGNDVAKQSMDMGSIVAALQQIVKAAQSTPPESGK